MSWNYRVVREDDPDGTPFWSIREVYYNKDGTVKTWSANPQHPSGETLRELQANIAMHQRALCQRGFDVTSGIPVELTAVSGRPLSRNSQRRGK